MKEKEAEPRPVDPEPDGATPAGDAALEEGQLDGVSGGVGHSDMVVKKKQDSSSGSLF
jgi:hypothetical protein